MRAISPEAMKKADRYTIDVLGVSGYELMKRASETVFRQAFTGHEKESYLILCGKGNNGGDGYAVGGFILENGGSAVCANVFDSLPSSDEAKSFKLEFEKAGGRVLCAEKEITAYMQQADCIIDGIFGTGYSGDILKSGAVGRIIDCANKSACRRIAIDVPSGANALDGSVAEVTFIADLTVTFAMPKPGLYSYPAKDFCGEVLIKDIGIKDEACNLLAYEYEIIDEAFVRGLMKKREQNSHKGSFGRLLCVCGSKNMTGAASLSAKGALRSGVGLVNIASESSVLDVLKTKLDEPVYTELDEVKHTLHKADALLIGCGIGRSKGSDERVYELLASYKKQIIIDADGINAVSDNINVLKKTEIPPIITPHPLELARLAGVDVSEINANRIGYAKRIATEHHVIVVLKGNATVVTDGQMCLINTTGNSGLAKGGSGDVLAGVIASLSAQGYAPLYAAAIGVYAHGLAADRLKNSLSEYGVIPSDLPAEIGRILGGI